MTEPGSATPAPAPTPAEAPGPTAGALLRRAREKQGLHIAALAASLKVPPAKLEALERDRYDQLPDATFARALAQTVCRALKVDAAPVLALLPRAEGAKLEYVASGLNAPFRDRPSAIEPTVGRMAAQPVVWVVALLLVAAAAVTFWPRSAPGPLVAPAPAPVASVPALAEVAASAVPESPGASAPVVETVFAAPAAEAAAASEPSVQGLLAVRVIEASWLEITDARGRTLLSRTVQPGETVGLDGALPLKLTIGNAAATMLAFRGEPVNLDPHTRDNIARLELK